MPKPTERTIKRKPMAVVMLTVERSKVKDDGTADVPEQGYDFEWFDTEANREKFFDQMNDFNQSDAKDHDDFAYITAVITDTANMTLGRVEVAPKSPEMTKWKNAVKKDPTLLLAPAAQKTTPAKKAVKPRGKTAAAGGKGTQVKKGAQGTAADAPKPRAVRAKPKAAGADKKAEAPANKAAELRKKLAAKKHVTPAEAEIAALEEALSADEPSKARQG